MPLLQHKGRTQPTPGGRLDAWVLDVLAEGGPYTLGELCRVLPQSSISPFFLAIERLSRAGAIRLVHRNNEDCLVFLNELGVRLHHETR